MSTMGWKPAFLRGVVARVRRPVGASLGNARGDRRRGVRSFILLEVIAAMVIVGFTIAAVLQGFTNGMRAISKDRIETQATLLAQLLLDSLEVEPPEENLIEGELGPETAFPGFRYTIELDTVERRYRDMGAKLERRDLETLRQVTVTILRQTSRDREPVQLLKVETYLTGVEMFGSQTKFLNALF